MIMQLYLAEGRVGSGIAPSVIGGRDGVPIAPAAAPIAAQLSTPEPRWLFAAHCCVGVCWLLNPPVHNRGTGSIQLTQILLEVMNERSGKFWIAVCT